jgi:hypothetical protein
MHFVMRMLTCSLFMRHEAHAALEGYQQGAPQQGRHVPVHVALFAGG